VCSAFVGFVANKPLRLVQAINCKFNGQRFPILNSSRKGHSQYLDVCWSQDQQRRVGDKTNKGRLTFILQFFRRQLNLYILKEC